MHSRIFQLQLAPVKKENYITADDFYKNNFVPVHGDYVTQSANRKADVEWFVAYTRRAGAIYNPEEGSIRFPKGFREEFYRQRLEALRRKVDNLTLEDFSANEYAVYPLLDLIHDTKGFFVCSNADFYMTLDQFLRGNLKVGRRYYFGNVLDYKF